MFIVGSDGCASHVVFIVDEFGKIVEIDNGRDRHGRRYHFEWHPTYVAACRINFGFGDPFYDGEFVVYDTLASLIAVIME